MYYLQSRYYDPAIGRFINADIFTTTDPFGILGYNMFAYCENDPIDRIDPSGHLFFAALGAVTGFIASGVTALIAGENSETTMRIAIAGAYGGAIAGAGVDLGLLIIGTGGIAAPIAAAMATVWFFGGIGNYVSASLTAKITATEFNFTQKMQVIAIGGAMNLLSFATGLDAAANSLMMISYKAMNSLDSNFFAGLYIGLSSSIATTIANQNAVQNRIGQPGLQSSVGGKGSPNTWRIDRLKDKI